MPRNDGSEVAELNELNAFDVVSPRTQLKLAQGQSTDAYRQLGESLVLLGECRNLFEIVALESPLRRDILALIQKIDAFKGDTDAH